MEQAAGIPVWRGTEVDAFHAGGLSAGGTNDGAPGPRNHFPYAYAAYFRDRAGNKICARTFTSGES